MPEIQQRQQRLDIITVYSRLGGVGRCVFSPQGWRIDVVNLRVGHIWKLLINVMMSLLPRELRQKQNGKILHKITLKPVSFRMKEIKISYGNFVIEQTGQQQDPIHLTLANIATILLHKFNQFPGSVTTTFQRNRSVYTLALGNTKSTDRYKRDALN